MNETLKKQSEDIIGKLVKLSLRVSDLEEKAFSNHQRSTARLLTSWGRIIDRYIEEVKTGGSEAILEAKKAYVRAAKDLREFEAHIK